MHAGVQVCIELQPIQIKVALIGCCFDLPARCIALNTVQFNGKYGCNFCNQPGRTFRTSRRGHVHTYPYSHQLPMRTQENWIQNAMEALQSCKPV